MRELIYNVIGKCLLIILFFAQQKWVYIYIYILRVPVALKIHDESMQTAGSFGQTRKSDKLCCQLRASRLPSATGMDVAAWFNVTVGAAAITAERGRVARDLDRIFVPLH